MEAPCVPRVLRFMTINVWYTAGGPTYAARLAGLRRWIAAVRPDVLALQEVLRDASLPACSVTQLDADGPSMAVHSGGQEEATGDGGGGGGGNIDGGGASLPPPAPYDQSHELLDGLGFAAVAYGAASSFWGDPSQVIGNAIASRHPILDAERLTLPSTAGDWEERGTSSKGDKAVPLTGVPANGVATSPAREVPPVVSRPPERRAAVSAVVATSAGTLAVTTAHLNWRLHDSPVRQAQVVALDAFALARGRAAAAAAAAAVTSTGGGPHRPFPSVLLGDFNAEPPSTELCFLRGHATIGGASTAWTDAWEAARRSAPAVAAAAATDGGETYVPSANPAAALEAEPDRRLDYVCVAPPAADGRGAVVRSRVVCDWPDGEGVFPSDHYGVVADLRADAVRGLAAERRRLGWSHASPHPGEGEG
ncbi:hypothetical protein I4F81_005511 [Pyropia yezoensis]|uniref:Uncharacterized protein n=1 Tax=Pyropia yezoensis TaxID=2788 RepID=A0ACC3BYJ9_PYRYE|nr:hypothetical protein I4F81_005511 [Neopyropia yezoensis]